MKTVRAFLSGKTSRLIWLSFALGSLFLIADFLFGAYYFHGGSLTEQIRMATAYENYLRFSLVSVVAAALALLSYLLIISSRLRVNQRQLEQELREQKRIEAALLESEERYRLLVDQSPFGIGIYQDGQAIFVNRSVVKQMGAKSADELVGKSINIFVHPEAWEATRARIQRMLQGEGGLYPVEARFARLDGSELPVQVTAAPFTFRGRPAVQVIALDISERKQAEAAVALAEANYRAMVENATIGIFQSTPAGQFRSVNPAMAHIYGYASPADMLAGVSDIANQIYVDLADRQAFQSQLAERGEVANFIAENYHRDGRRLWTVTNARAVHDAQGQILYYEGFLTDITARIQAEEEAQRLSQQVRLILETAGEGIFGLNAAGELTFVNPLAAGRLGFAAEEMIGHSGHALWHYARPDRTPYPEDECPIWDTLRDGQSRRGEEYFWRKDGSGLPVEFTVTAMEAAGRVSGAVVTFRDITERQRADEAVRFSEEKFRSLIEQSSEGVVLLDEGGQIVEWNHAQEQITGIPRAEALGVSFGDIQFQVLPPERRAGHSVESFRKALAGAFQTGQIPRLAGANEITIQTASGERKTIHQAAFPIKTDKGYRIGALVRDITDRKQAEEALRASEQRYRTIFQTAAVSIWEEDFTAVRAALDELRAQGVTDFSSYLAEHREFVRQAAQLVRVRDVNDATLRMYGATEKGQLLGALDDVIVAETLDSIREELVAIAEGRGYFESETINQTLDGRRIHGWLTMTIPTEAGQLDSVLVSVVDITGRKQAEAALRASENQFREMAEQLVDVLYVTDPGGLINYVSPSVARVFGWTPEEMTGRPFVEFLPPPEMARAMEKFRATLQFGQPAQYLELTMKRKDGSTFAGELNGAPLVREGRVAGAIGLIRDVTERQQADARIQAQLQRLAGLRAIDDTIIGSFDMGLALGEVLNQTATQLHADAACVLLLHRPLQRLTYVAGRGLRTEALKHTNLRLGEGHAGQAALERRTIRVPDLRAAGSDFQRSPHLAAEGFVAYYGVPLMAKGQVEGVLEVFQRGPHNPDDEWLDFLETLAKQAAIAVDNAQLFAGLQRANADLYLAYDDTIEGWSRALDLRDRETEGHTRRVTDMTLRLARAMGLAEAELVHVRRGALLHDIGKMGIPDSILLKPGPLTEGEWAVMRKHPTYAFELLAPIPYLRPALDIPYSHHERWDGSGYPRGLKREGIPQAARLFAVVDVWDALRSDRPYRPAWPEAKVLEHLRTGAGTHFDPVAVDLFLRELRET